MTALSDARLTLVESTEDVNDFLSWLGERRPVLGVDSETTGLSLTKDSLRLVQFGDANAGWALPYRDWRGVIRQALTRYDGPIVLQHAKFDAGFLTRDSMPFPWERAHDTMIMAFLHDSQGPKSLKAAASLYVDPMASAGEVALKKAMAKNRWTYESVPIDFPPYWGYAALDSVITARLAEYLWPRVQSFREAYDLELACERVLHDMEQRGVAIDVDYCEEHRGELLVELDEAQEALGDLNPNSPTQVADALKRSGAKLTKRTENGQLSVDDDVLTDLERSGNTVARDVLVARSAQKLLTTYFENFLEYHDDGILRPHINQLAARTGRMSVTEPALQTIPRKSIVRDAFIPRPGNRLVLIDYDNQELRVAAHFAQDPTMLKAFREGRSLHDETASRLYGPDYTKGQRSTAKNAMFSKAYGAGVDKFARTAGIPYGEAAQVYNTLDSLYPNLGRIMAKVTQTVRSRTDTSGRGYVQLVDGRHLKVRGDKAYVGFNALIQGSCAVVLKQSLVDLDAAGFGEFLALPIHDEIMFDVPFEILDEVLPPIKEIMTRDEYAAPLTVSASIAERWGDGYR